MSGTAATRVPTPGTDGASLGLRVGGQTVALPMTIVREVVRPSALTRVPQAPRTLLGLMNLRGKVLPVLSLEQMLAPSASGAGVHRGSFESAQRIVVVTGSFGSLGLLVDGVLGAAAADLPQIDIATKLPALAAPTPARKNAARGADVRSAAPERGPQRALLGFNVGGREFALDLDRVDAVSDAAARPEAVPGTDAAMLGVVPARDGLLPLLSAATLLGLSENADVTADARPVRRTIVTRIGGVPAGLAVDAVTGILRVPADRIEPVPGMLLRGRIAEARIEGICRLQDGARLVQILHPDHLLDAETTRRLSALSPDAAGTDQRDVEGSLPDRQDDDTSEQFLLFRLGTERYGLPIGAVDEIVRHPGSLSRVPNAPDMIEGVMNLRGRVLPVIDQARRFAAVPAADATRRRIVVCTIGALRVGFAVDSVSEVARFRSSSLAPAPGFAPEDALFDRVVALEEGEGMVLLVDPASLLDSVEREILAAMVARADPSVPVASKRRNKQAGGPDAASP